MPEELLDRGSGGCRRDASGRLAVEELGQGKASMGIGRRSGGERASSSRSMGGRGGLGGGWLVGSMEGLGGLGWIPRKERSGRLAAARWDNGLDFRVAA